MLSEGLAKLISSQRPLRIRYFSAVSGTQQGQDDGGLCRDWFHRLSNELAHPSTRILKTQDENFSGRYQLENEADLSGLDKQNLVFLGRLLGLALVLNIPLSLDFIPLFYKSLVREDHNLQDLAFVDKGLFRSLEKLDEFSRRDTDDFETAAESITFMRPVGEGGSEEISLTRANFLEFRAGVLRERLVDAQLPRVALILEGLTEFIPLNYLVLLQAEELRSLISSGGSNTLNMEDWKRQTIYEECTAETVCLSCLSCPCFKPSPQEQHFHVGGCGVVLGAS